MLKPSQFCQVNFEQENSESSGKWREAELVAEQGLGAQRFGWIRWYQDASGVLKVASHSKWIANIGLEALDRGCEFNIVSNLLREADQGVLKAHLDAGFEKQSSAAITVRLKNERWLEIVSRVQDDSLDERFLFSLVYDVTREKRMELKNRNLEQIIDAIPSWVFLKNKDHRYVRVNPAYATVYGLEPRELIGKTSVDLGVDEELALGNPEKGIVGYYADDDWVLSNHQSKYIPSEPIVVNGELRYLSTVKMPVYDAVDECELVLGLAHDITHLKEIESKIATELRYNKTLYDINELFRTSGDSLSIYNKVCEVALAALKCSRVAIVVDGKSSGQCILSEKCCDESLCNGDPADCTSAVIEFDESVFGVLELERDAENGKFSEDDKRLGQGIANHLALAIQQHELYREIRHQARHDSLTDLPNRYHLMDDLAKTVEACKKRHNSCAIMLLDLNGFKHVNDTMGHQTGDQLLLAVSERLKQARRGKDMLARLGGDEFALLIHEIPGQEYAVQRASQLVEHFNAPFQIQNRQLDIGASIGVSVYPDDATDSVSLLKHADMAMYDSKSKGRNTFQIFSPALEKKEKRVRELEAALRIALHEENELSLVYQPKICLNTGKLVGVEALTRWNNASLGAILPTEFIPLAEESGLILPLGQWLLKTACEEVGKWNTSRTSSIALSVNASPVELEQQDFVSSAKSVLHESGFEASLLEFEVTESVFMHRFGIVTKCLQELRDIGISVSIDDFGTGYSSLSYLQKLPVDTLKIDKSFVDQLDVANEAGVSGDESIVSTIVSLANTLGLKTVAEGIETERQASVLQQIGTDMGQGYFFSRPMDRKAIEKYLAVN